MHGVTLSRHQPICAMAHCFPDFALSLFFFSFFYSPSNLAWPRTRIWKRAPSFNWYKTTCNSTNYMEINFGTKVLMKTPSQLVATGGNKHRFVDEPNVEIDGIYNLSTDEKHQRVNTGGRLSDSLKVFSFLTRELRACARASCRYAVGNGIRLLARLVDSSKLFFNFRLLSAFDSFLRAINKRNSDLCCQE